MKCESIIYVTFQTRSQCMHKCTWTQRENKFSKILGFKFLPSHRVWVSTPCSGVKPLKGQGGRRGVLTPTPFISLPPTVPSLQLRDWRKSDFMYNNNFLFLGQVTGATLHIWEGTLLSQSISVFSTKKPQWCNPYKKKSTVMSEVRVCVGVTFFYRLLDSLYRYCSLCQYYTQKNKYKPLCLLTFFETISEPC